MTKSKGDGWLGVPDVCRELGVGQRTVYALIDRDGLVAYKLGRVIRIRRSDLEDFLDRQRIQPGDLRHLYPDVEGEGPPEPDS